MPHTSVSKRSLVVPASELLPALDAIYALVRKDRLPPTYEEIAAALSLTKMQARTLVKHLCAAGYARRKEGQPRTLVISRSGLLALTRLRAGRIAASRKPLTPTRKLKGAA